MRETAFIHVLALFLFTSGTAMAVKCGNTFIKDGAKSIEGLEPRAMEEIKLTSKKQ